MISDEIRCINIGPQIKYGKCPHKKNRDKFRFGGILKTSLCDPVKEKSHNKKKIRLNSKERYKGKFKNSER